MSRYWRIEGKAVDQYRARVESQVQRALDVKRGEMILFRITYAPDSSYPWTIVRGEEDDIVQATDLLMALEMLHPPRDSGKDVARRMEEALG